MNCQVLNMAFFDVLQEAKVVGVSGEIKGNYEENVDGILCNNRLMQILLCEDYDDPEAWELVNQDKYMKEFIFKILQHFAVGGSLCQYEDNLQEYLNIVKLMYKDLVAVAKDPDSQEIKCFSLVFRIDSIEGFENRLYNTKYDAHPQNFFYVCIDPINWHVNFFYHTWKNHW